MNIDESIKNFIQNAAPTEWFDYADELFENAKNLLKHSGENITIEHFNCKNIRRLSISRSYILLIALAIENSIKGYLISKNPNLIVQGRLDKSLETHSILHLIENNSDIDINSEERKVVIILQDSIPYWGRYPVPLKFQQLKKEHLLNEDFIKISDSLFERLQKKLFDSYKSGWDSGTDVVLLSSENSKYK